MDSRDNEYADMRAAEMDREDAKIAARAKLKEARAQLESAKRCGALGLEIGACEKAVDEARDAIIFAPIPKGQGLDYCDACGRLTHVDQIDGGCCFGCYSGDEIRT
jgi:hypothetical protein